MDTEEAKQFVQNQWKITVEESLGCSVDFDDSLTVEYEWGWLFCFVAIDPEKCKKSYHKAAFAYDLESGISVPVGTKGLQHALGWIVDLKNRANFR